jgi:hypothetical protein
MREEAAFIEMEIMSRHFGEVTEKIHENTHSGLSVSGW